MSQSGITDVLAPALAKKMLAQLQKPTKKSSWQEWSGEGGVGTPVRFEEISREELAKIQLPDCCGFLQIRSNTQVQGLGPAAMTALQPLAGVDWVLPARGAETSSSLNATFSDFPLSVHIGSKEESSSEELLKTQNYGPLRGCHPVDGEFTIMCMPSREVPSSHLQTFDPSDHDVFLRHANELMRRHALPHQAKERCLPSIEPIFLSDWAATSEYPALLQRQQGPFSVDSIRKQEDKRKDGLRAPGYLRHYLYCLAAKGEIISAESSGLPFTLEGREKDSCLYTWNPTYQEIFTLPEGFSSYTQFLLPNPKNQTVFRNGRMEAQYDYTQTTWRKNHFSPMAEEMLGRAVGQVELAQRSSVGMMSWFQLGISNFREEAQELLQRTLDLNRQETFSGSYLHVGPEDWRAREKRRKKWKKLMEQELGSITFENGSRADVSLIIEAEGYRFRLDFADPESQFRFAETKAFALTQWHPC